MAADVGLAESSKAAKAGALELEDVESAEDVKKSLLGSTVDVYDQVFRESVIMGVINFSTVPGAYFMGRAHADMLFYVLTLLQASLGVWWQARIVNLICAAFPGTDFPEKFQQQRWKVPIAGCTVACVPYWLGKLVSGMAEYVDPAFDGMTAGSAHLSKKIENAFVNSWLQCANTHKWCRFVGDWVAHLGLAGSLTQCLLIASCSQLVMMLDIFREAFSAKNADVIKSSAHLAMAMEIASLGLASEAVMEAWGSKVDSAGIIIFTKWWFKFVLEALPMLWLSISLVTLKKAFGVSAWHLKIPLVSIFTSFSAVIACTKDLLVTYVPRAADTFVKYVYADAPDLCSAFDKVCRLLLGSFLFIIIGLPLSLLPPMLVKLGSNVWCPQDFSLVAGCVDFNTTTPIFRAAG